MLLGDFGLLYVHCTGSNALVENHILVTNPLNPSFERPFVQLKNQPKLSGTQCSSIQLFQYSASQWENLRRATGDFTPHETNGPKGCKNYLFLVNWRKEVGNRWTQWKPWAKRRHMASSITHTGSTPHARPSIRHIPGAIGCCVFVCLTYGAANTRQYCSCNLLIFPLLWSNFIKHSTCAVLTFFSLFGLKSIVGH